MPKRWQGGRNEGSMAFNPSLTLATLGKDDVLGIWYSFCDSLKKSEGKSICAETKAFK